MAHTIEIYNDDVEIPVTYQGPKGDPGEKGDKGDPGTPGTAGARGERGEKGDTGAQGLQGIQGPQGLPGDKGEPGAKGDPGIQGIQGIQGEQGVAGERGERGEKGDTGAQGLQGIQGPQGLPGDKGEPGAKGDPGIQGIQGIQGEQGVAGERGERGEKGDTGVQGLQGIQGEQGVAGENGEPGAKGDPGLQGLQGIQGEQGPIGPTGSKGDTGAKGDPGAKGDTPVLTRKLDDILINNDANIDWFYLDHPVKFGYFKYDATDTASNNDEAIVIVDSLGRRYKREFTGNADVRWWGIGGNGTVDDESKWLAMLNNPRVKSVIVPYSTHAYRIRNLKIPSNIEINLEPGVVIKGMGVGWTQELIQLTKVSNVTINGYGAYLDGFREDFPTPSEFIGCFGIRNCENVTINGLTIRNFNGDGAYLGLSDFSKHNTNIHFNDVYIENVSRNGISVIDSNGVWINNCRINGANGSFPKSGIDVEPNGNAYWVKGLHINNLYTQNCLGVGILLALRALGGGAEHIDITITNHVDEGSHHAFSLGVVNTLVKGSINVTNPIWRNNLNSAFLLQEYSTEAPCVDIYNPKVINPIMGGTGFLGFFAAFLFFRNAGGTINTSLGNVNIHEPSIIEERTVDIPNYAAFMYIDREDTKTHSFDNCYIWNPKRLDRGNKGRGLYMRNASKSPLKEDKYGALKYSITDEATISVSNTDNYYSSFNNSSATVDTVFTLGDLHDETFIVFEVESSRTITVNTGTARRIYPYDLQGIKSNTPGSRIKLIRDLSISGVSTGGWRVLEMEGVWEDINNYPLSGRSYRRVQLVSNAGVGLQQASVVVYADNTTTSTTVWLPPVAKAKGETVTIIRTSDFNTARFLRVQGDASDLIDGVNIRTLIVKGEGIKVISDGVSWRIIEQFGNEYANYAENLSYTVVPSKNTLNTAYGDRKSGYVVYAPNIAGGAKKYTKLTNAPDSNWGESGYTIIS